MLQALSLYHLIYTVFSSLEITLLLSLSCGETPTPAWGISRPPDFIRSKVVERFPLIHWQPYLPSFVTNLVSFADQIYAVLSAISMSRLSKSIYST